MMIPQDVIEGLEWVRNSLEDVQFGEIKLSVAMHQGRVSKVIRSVTVSTLSSVHESKPVEKKRP